MNYLSHSPEDTIHLGYLIGQKLTKGAFLALSGDLAGGKTTFTKGIGQALHIKRIINSPTFNILKIYHGDLDLYHIDAYRLKDSNEDLGFEEMMDEGIMVVEWAEYFKDFLPNEYLELHFDYQDDNTRTIKLIPHGKTYEKILEELKI